MIDIFLGLSIILLGGTFIYQQFQLRTLLTLIDTHTALINWLTQRVGELMPNGEDDDD